MTNAVLVVDMLKGFLEEGCPLYCGKKACDIIPNVKALLQEESKKGSKIFFICDSHAPDDAEFKMFPPHCIQGTKECEVIPELSGFGGEIIPKNRYSAFFGTELESKLKKLNRKSLLSAVSAPISASSTAWLMPETASTRWKYPLTASPHLMKKPTSLPLLTWKRF